jgi:hypothetical protein
MITLTDAIAAGFGFMANILITALILFVAAKIAKIHDARFGSALSVAVLASLLGFFLAFLTGFAGIISFIFMIVFIKVMYHTTWMKTSITWVLYLIIGSVISYVLILLGYSSLL